MLPNPSAGNMLTVYGPVFDNAPRPPLSRSVGLTAATGKRRVPRSSPALVSSLSDIRRLLAPSAIRIACTKLPFLLSLAPGFDALYIFAATKFLRISCIIVRKKPIEIDKWDEFSLSSSRYFYISREILVRRLPREQLNGERSSAN